MSFFRFRWLHRFIRRHSSPIPEDNASLWKRRLSLTYAFLAWNAFGFVCYNVYKGKVDWPAYHGLKEPEQLSPGQQWAKTLNKKNAQVYRIDGFQVSKIDEINENNHTAEQSEKI